MKVYLSVLCVIVSYPLFPLYVINLLILSPASLHSFGFGAAFALIILFFNTQHDLFPFVLVTSTLLSDGSFHSSPSFLKNMPFDSPAIYGFPTLAFPPADSSSQWTVWTLCSSVPSVLQTSCSSPRFLLWLISLPDVSPEHRWTLSNNFQWPKLGWCWVELLSVGSDRNPFSSYCRGPLPWLTHSNQSAERSPRSSFRTHLPFHW